MLSEYKNSDAIIENLLLLVDEEGFILNKEHWLFVWDNEIVLSISNCS